MSNDRLNRPDPLANLAPGYTPPDEPSAPLTGSTWEAARRRRTESNPWTTALAAIGGIGVLLGLILYAVGRGAQSEAFAEPGAGDAAVLAGVGFIGIGVTMLTIWIAVNAIIWQMKQPSS
jgi:hypothetical protein